MKKLISIGDTTEFKKDALKFIPNQMIRAEEQASEVIEHYSTLSRVECVAGVPMGKVLRTLMSKSEVLMGAGVLLFSTPESKMSSTICLFENPEQLTVANISTVLQALSDDLKMGMPSIDELPSGSFRITLKNNQHIVMTSLGRVPTDIIYNSYYHFSDNGAVNRISLYVGQSLLDYCNQRQLVQLEPLFETSKAKTVNILANPAIKEDNSNLVYPYATQQAVETLLSDCQAKMDAKEDPVAILNYCNDIVSRHTVVKRIAIPLLIERASLKITAGSTVDGEYNMLQIIRSLGKESIEYDLMPDLPIASQADAFNTIAAVGLQEIGIEDPIKKVVDKNEFLRQIDQIEGVFTCVDHILSGFLPVADVHPAFTQYLDFIDKEIGKFFLKHNYPNPFIPYPFTHHNVQSDLIALEIRVQHFFMVALRSCHAMLDSDLLAPAEKQMLVSGIVRGLRLNIRSGSPAINQQLDALCQDPSPNFELVLNTVQEVLSQYNLFQNPHLEFLVDQSQRTRVLYTACVATPQLQAQGHPQPKRRAAQAQVPLTTYASVVTQHLPVHVLYDRRTPVKNAPKIVSRKLLPTYSENRTQIREMALELQQNERRLYHHQASGQYGEAVLKPMKSAILRERNRLKNMITETVGTYLLEIFLDLGLVPPHRRFHGVHYLCRTVLAIPIHTKVHTDHDMRELRIVIQRCREVRPFLSQYKEVSKEFGYDIVMVRALRDHIGTQLGYIDQGRECHRLYQKEFKEVAAIAKVALGLSDDVKSVEQLSQLVLDRRDGVNRINLSKENLGQLESVMRKIEDYTETFVDGTRSLGELKTVRGLIHQLITVAKLSKNKFMKSIEIVKGNNQQLEDSIIVIASGEKEKYQRQIFESCKNPKSNIWYKDIELNMQASELMLAQLFKMALGPEQVGLVEAQQEELTRHQDNYAKMRADMQTAAQLKDMMEKFQHLEKRVKKLNISVETSSQTVLLRLKRELDMAVSKSDTVDANPYYELGDALFGVKNTIAFLKETRLLITGVLSAQAAQSELTADEEQASAIDELMQELSRKPGHFDALKPDPLASGMRSNPDAILNRVNTVITTYLELSELMGMLTEVNWVDAASLGTESKAANQRFEKETGVKLATIVKFKSEAELAKWIDEELEACFLGPFHENPGLFLDSENVLELPWVSRKTANDGSIETKDNLLEWVWDGLSAKGRTRVLRFYSNAIFHTRIPLSPQFIRYSDRHCATLDKRVGVAISEWSLNDQFDYLFQHLALSTSPTHEGNLVRMVVNHIKRNKDKLKSDNGLNMILSHLTWLKPSHRLMVLRMVRPLATTELQSISLKGFQPSDNLFEWARMLMLFGASDKTKPTQDFCQNGSQKLLKAAQRTASDKDSDRALLLKVISYLSEFFKDPLKADSFQPQVNLIKDTVRLLNELANSKSPKWCGFFLEYRNFYLSSKFILSLTSEKEVKHGRVMRLSDFYARVHELGKAKNPSLHLSRKNVEVFWAEGNLVLNHPDTYIATRYRQEQRDIALDPLCHITPDSGAKTGYIGFSDGLKRTVAEFMRNSVGNTGSLEKGGVTFKKRVLPRSFPSLYSGGLIENSVLFKEMFESIIEALVEMRNCPQAEVKLKHSRPHRSLFFSCLVGANYFSLILQVAGINDPKLSSLRETLQEISECIVSWGEVVTTAELEFEANIIIDKRIQRLTVINNLLGHLRTAANKEGASESDKKKYEAHLRESKELHELCQHTLRLNLLAFGLGAKTLPAELMETLWKESFQRFNMSDIAEDPAAILDLCVIANAPVSSKSKTDAKPSGITQLLLGLHRPDRVTYGHGKKQKIVKFYDAAGKPVWPKTSVNNPRVTKALWSSLADTLEKGVLAPHVGGLRQQLGFAVETDSDRVGVHDQAQDEASLPVLTVQQKLTEELASEATMATGFQSLVTTLNASHYGAEERQSIIEFARDAIMKIGKVAVDQFLIFIECIQSEDCYAKQKIMQGIIRPTDVVDLLTHHGDACVAALNSDLNEMLKETLIKLMQAAHDCDYLKFTVVDSHTDHYLDFARKYSVLLAPRSVYIWGVLGRLTKLIIGSESECYLAAGVQADTGQSVLLSSIENQSEALFNDLDSAKPEEWGDIVANITANILTPMVDALSASPGLFVSLLNQYPGCLDHFFNLLVSLIKHHDRYQLPPLDKIILGLFGDLESLGNEMWEKWAEVSFWCSVATVANNCTVIKNQKEIGKIIRESEERSDPTFVSRTRKLSTVYLAENTEIGKKNIDLSTMMTTINCFMGDKMTTWAEEAGLTLDTFVNQGLPDKALEVARVLFCIVMEIPLREKDLKLYPELIQLITNFLNFADLNTFYDKFAKLKETHLSLDSLLILILKQRVASSKNTDSVLKEFCEKLTKNAPKKSKLHRLYPYFVETFLERNPHLK